MNILNIRISHGYGGAEKFIISLFNSLSNKYVFNVTHFTNNTKLYKNLKIERQRVYKLADELDEVGTKMEILYFLKYIRKYIYSYKRIFNYLANSDTDIIILHSTTEKLLLTFIFKKRGYKVVWFEHGPFYIVPRAMIIKIFHRRVSVYADKILAVSKGTKFDLMKGGVPSNKIIVFYIGIDTNMYKPNKTLKRVLRKKMKIDPKTYCIGYIGNVNYEKGIGRFMEVADNLNEGSDKFSYIVIGTGPAVGEIKKINKSLRNKYICTGHVDNIHEYLNILDVMLLPTEHIEGISLAILEAMSMGICVVTKDIGGSKEIISNNINGILYKKFLAKRISDIILVIYDNSIQIRQIKINARKTIIENFKLSNSALKFKEIIQTL